MKKPNVLFLMCDQLRGDSLGCMGNSIVKTPNIDALAQSGMLFTRAYTPDPICVPARATIITGKYPHKCTGVKANKGAIHDGIKTLPATMAQNGYRTYSIGKLHYNPYRLPQEGLTVHGFETYEICESGRALAAVNPQGDIRGIEHYHDYLYDVGWGGYERGDGMGNNDVYPNTSPLPAEHYVDAWVATRAIEHIRTHLKNHPDEPFFMHASFPKPHSAFDPPRPWDAMYDPRQMPLPNGDIEIMKKRGHYEAYMKHFSWMFDKLSDAALQTIKARYYGLISFQDAQIGRLIQTLKDEGVYEDTIILYTADHGEMLGDFGCFAKQVFYEPSAHIPMMIAYPRQIPAGRKSSALVGLTDIFPTLAGLCGFEAPEDMDGLDLTQTLLTGEPVRDFYVGQCNDGAQARYMLIDEQYKYLYTAAGAIDELYDVAADPQELENLADQAQYSDVVSQMKARLLDWCVENGDADILENGRLKAYPLPELKPVKVGNTFGRRKY